MKLIKIAGEPCHGPNTCPATYLTDEGTVLVQGTHVNDVGILEQIQPPAHEVVVEIPLALLKEASARVS